MGLLEIADSLDISLPTLRLYFKKELAHGALLKRQELILRLHRAGRDGNVAATKAFFALADKIKGEQAFVPTADNRPGAPVERQDPESGEELGKKAQRDQAAVGAEKGTGWDGLLPGGKDGGNHLQ